MISQVCVFISYLLGIFTFCIEIALPLATPTPPPSPSSPTSPLPCTLPEEYPLLHNPLDAVGLNSVHDFWNQQMFESINFQAMQLLLWQAIHSRRASQGPSFDPDHPSIEEDFRYCLDHLLVIPYPDQFCSSLDRFFHLIRAQRASEYPQSNPDGSSRHYLGSSPYYAAMYQSGYSSMQTILSSALEWGGVLQQDLDSDDIVLDSINDLVTVAQSSLL